MPYYKRYRRRFYKKKRSYNKRKFSRFNTYKNRSSKSQAYQIYSLNRKINRIEYKTRPEYKTIVNRAHSAIYTNDDGTGGHQFWHILNSDNINFLQNIDGEFARFIGLKFWGNVFRPENALADIYSWFRVIVLQYPHARGDGVSVPDLFLSYTDQTVVDADINRPFIEHVSKTVKILADKKFVLSNSDVKNKPFKFRVRPKLNIAKNPNENIAAGDIDVLIIYKQASQTTTSSGCMDINFKLCYTDS